MNKNIFAVLTSSVVAVTVISATPLKSQALTVNFSFDSTFNGTVTPPIVGTGTFSFDGDPGTGTFALTSLANYNFSFNFNNGLSFTNTDIRTPVANVLVRILDNGTDRFVNFGGSGGGPFGGSLDFRNAIGLLTFQPGFGPLYQASGVSGTYQGIIPGAPTPVPAPPALLGVLFASLAGAVAKSKQKAQPSLEKVN